MSTLNIKIPEDMDEHLNDYVDESGAYLNKSELVRDAIRRYFEERPLRLSEQTLEDDRISREQIESGSVVALSDVNE